ncbi:MAG: DUF2235 domain-containing protein [Xanthomonadaceae bacterium]|nr:DUF2235 domain-containing protein [Xanthomonadaceae bacterium]
MTKRIVICADGTWNRPEQELDKDRPTNVLRFARAIAPFADKPQQVFYDWGVGSYYDPVLGGAMGNGLEKNVMDDYRYIVQNYSEGDEIYLFGFSRGAYTVRSVCGLINNLGILKRPDARLIEQAFLHYKDPAPAWHPDGEESKRFRERHAHASREVRFVGAWDTVGALGIPLSFLGFLNKRDEFYDSKIGPNVRIARHALAIDELRSDFQPTLWEPRPGLNLKQVWFAGVHSDVGGGYAPDESDSVAADIPLGWMLGEAHAAGLRFEPHLAEDLQPNPLAAIHNSRKHIYRSKRPYYRKLEHGQGPTLIHRSVKARWEDGSYKPRNLKAYLDANGWERLVGSRTVAEPA